jgi:hypothetical protein
MSTSPIGTRVPTLAPNAIIRAGIPLSDNFNATDVAVSLGSLLDSGSWTPVVSGVTYSEIVNILAANYSRVGTIVTCSLFIDVELNAAETQADFQFSLPVASDFTNVKDAFGIIAFNGNITEFIAWGIQADTATNKIVINVQSTTAGIGYQYLYVMLQYEIK